jgi:hypothetical protein
MTGVSFRTEQAKIQQQEGISSIRRQLLWPVSDNYFGRLGSVISAASSSVIVSYDSSVPGSR